MATSTAGLLLTGGASRRLGVDKAELIVSGERLADRGARVLAAVCDPSLEVGPGRTTLDAVREEPPGTGPLAALAAGAAALQARGHRDAVLVLAVDLPFVEVPLLELLAGRTGDGVAVPVAGGHRQPCCARYGPGALETAAALLARGERSLQSLLAATLIDEIAYLEWRAVAPVHALDDLDTPEDLTRHGISAPQ
jgi:molybdopterin-guanine dinucleotide biosynthesis protein A